MNQPVSATRAGISRTAIWVAAARAIGARDPDPEVRNPDSLAEALLGDPSRLPLKHPVVSALDLPYEEAMRDFEIVGIVRAMMIRTRFIDEALARAISAGATQVLILGAGLDSHAYRFRELLSSARVFELDLPATLEFKKQRVAEALGGAPGNLTYVPFDPAGSVPETLLRHGYEGHRRTFILMEGVSMYLPEESLRDTLRFAAGHGSGSALVFDFATKAMVEGIRRIDLAMLPPAARPSMEHFLEVTRDEPWLSGIPLDSEREYLAGLGLELRQMLTIGDAESAKRYLTRKDGTTVGQQVQATSEQMRKNIIDKMVEQAGEGQREAIEARMREQGRQMAYRITEVTPGGA